MEVTWDQRSTNHAVQSRGTMKWRCVYGFLFLFLHCSSLRITVWRKDSERRHFCPSSFSPTVGSSLQAGLQTSVKLLPSDSNLDLGEQTQKVLLPSISTWEDFSGGLWWAGTPRNSKTDTWTGSGTELKKVHIFLYYKTVEYGQKEAADHQTDRQLLLFASYPWL